MKNRKLNRKKDYDYSWIGSYFVTICSKNFSNVFGVIENDEIDLSDEGQVAADCWNDIINHSKYVELDAFVVMPNHVHGIIHLLPTASRDKPWFVPTGNLKQVKRMNERLPNVIKQYKSSVTRIIRNKFNNYKFGWQRSYHDRIIRNEKELGRIRLYIDSNPYAWKDDDENPMD